jgi:hypothetical protein
MVTSCVVGAVQADEGGAVILSSSGIDRRP